ncbi:MAG: ATP-binding protein [Proteobacteria bacterium]|nr:ATP-binding protein [Pseudomonadota bacterium]
MKFTLPSIEHNKGGFEALALLYAQAQNCVFEDIEIDMQNTKWFDADMCAAFGAVLHNLSDKLNTVKLINITPSIEAILSKNRFLTHYGHSKITDNWGTTISYRHFDVKDGRAFAEYLASEFINRPEVPNMSHILKKKFQESIYEIFNNSVTHSQTSLGIFSCGQFFPNRNRLDFSVTDLGIGIRKKIQEVTGIELTPEKAIIWATTDRNTTKRGSEPGGLGLKLLSEFIDKNDGSMQIVSGYGYWKREKNKVNTAQLVQPFPGTIVNLEINTADLGLYMLASEITPEDIF